MSLGASNLSGFADAGPSNWKHNSATMKDSPNESPPTSQPPPQTDEFIITIHPQRCESSRPTSVLSGKEHSSHVSESHPDRGLTTQYPDPVDGDGTGAESSEECSIMGWTTAPNIAANKRKSSTSAEGASHKIKFRLRAKNVSQRQQSEILTSPVPVSSTKTPNILPRLVFSNRASGRPPPILKLACQPARHQNPGICINRSKISPFHQQPLGLTRMPSPCCLPDPGLASPAVGVSQSLITTHPRLYHPHTFIDVPHLPCESPGIHRMTSPNPTSYTRQGPEPTERIRAFALQNLIFPSNFVFSSVPVTGAQYQISHNGIRPIVSMAASRASTQMNHSTTNPPILPLTLNTIPQTTNTITLLPVVTQSNTQTPTVNIKHSAAPKHLIILGDIQAANHGASTPGTMFHVAKSLANAQGTSSNTLIADSTNETNPYESNTTGKIPATTSLTANDILYPLIKSRLSEAPCAKESNLPENNSIKKNTSLLCKEPFPLNTKQHHAYRLILPKPNTLSTNGVRACIKSEDKVDKIVATTISDALWERKPKQASSTLSSDPRANKPNDRKATPSGDITRRQNTPDSTIKCSATCGAVSTKIITGSVLEPFEVPDIATTIHPYPIALFKNQTIDLKQDEITSSKCIIASTSEMDEDKMTQAANNLQKTIKSTNIGAEFKTSGYKMLFNLLTQTNKKSLMPPHTLAETAALKTENVLLEGTWSGDKKYVCTNCKTDFNTQVSLKIHQLFTWHNHHESQPVCSYCGKQFLSEANVICHEVSWKHCTKWQHNICPLCAKIFVNTLGLRHHLLHCRVRICCICDVHFTVAKEDILRLASTDPALCAACAGNFVSGSECRSKNKFQYDSNTDDTKAMLSFEFPDSHDSVAMKNYATTSEHRKPPSRNISSPAPRGLEYSKYQTRSKIVAPKRAGRHLLKRKLSKKQGSADVLDADCGKTKVAEATDEAKSPSPVASKSACCQGGSPGAPLKDRVKPTQVVERLKPKSKRKPKVKDNKKVLSKIKHKETRRYECPVCSTLFKKRCRYEEHVTTHPGVQPYSCSNCGRQFKKKCNLQAHSALHDGRPYQCCFCNREFRRRPDLNIHVRTHLEGTYCCTECPAQCSSHHALQRHMLGHSQEVHDCPKCDKRFKSNGSLKSHLKRHSEERAFACKMCDKRFVVKEDLKSHSIIHGNRNQFVCAQCGKTFAQRTTFAAHMRVHSGEKPFQCSLCNKQFSSLSNLKYHQKTHTGERPFACSACGKRCTSSGNLRSHIRHMHLK